MFESSEIEGRVPRIGRLPAQVLVGRRRYVDAVFARSAERGAVPRTENIGRGGAVDIALGAVGYPQAQVVEPPGVAQEPFAVDAPCARDGPHRVELVFGVHAEEVRAVVAHRTENGVAVVVGVRPCEEVRHVAVFVEAFRILPETLVVQQVAVFGYVDRFGRHRFVVVSESLGVYGRVGYAAHLQTGHQVQFMLSAERARIFGLRFPVVLREVAVPVLDYAAFRQAHYLIHH